MRKDWNSYVGRKFDMLTVAEVIAPAMAQKMLNLSYKQTHFVCVCDCGAVRYAAAVAVERGYITSCGSDECKNKIKKSKRAAFAICAAKSATAAAIMTYAATVRRNADTAD